MRTLQKIIMIILATGAICSAAAVNLEAIRPYLEEQTFGVIRLDFSTVDTQAFVDMMDIYLKPVMDTPEAYNSFKQEIQQAKQDADKGIGEFIAAGGKDVYVLFNAIDIPGCLVVAPFYPGATGKDPQGLAISLKGINDFPSLGQNQVRQNAVVIGSEMTLARLAALMPAARPEIEKALTENSSAGVQVIFTPTSEQMRVLKEMVPPQPMGNEANSPMLDIAGMIQAIRFASAAATWPAKPAESSKSVVDAVTLKLNIQCVDAAAATNLLAQNDVAYRFISTLPDFQSNKLLMDDMFKLMTPVAEGNQLRLTLAGPQVKEIITKNLAGPMAQARKKAQQVQSMNNIKQLLLGCIMYADDNSNQFPADLKAVMPKYVTNPEVLKNPAQLQRPEGYVYVKPAAAFNQVKEPATTVLIYEKFEQWPAQGICVGFADGHVEVMKRQDDFNARLKTSTGK